MESNAFLLDEERLRNAIFTGLRSWFGIDLVPPLQALSLPGLGPKAGMGIGALLAVAACLIAVLLWSRGARWTILATAITISGAILLSEGLKHLITRPPPLNSGQGHSFPSGHASAASACAVCIMYIAMLVETRPLRAVLLVAVICVEIVAVLSSLTEHYPSDVFGGITLALGWSGAVATALSPRLAGELPRRRREG